MKKLLLTSTILGALSSHTALAQWTQASVNGMTYEVLLPQNYNPNTSYAGVLFLHQMGMGADWDGGDGGLEGEFTPALQAMQAAHPSIVVLPLLDQSADPSGQTINFGGVQGSTAGEANAVAAMQQVMSQYNINTSRVYVTGASMGAQGAVQVLEDYGPNSNKPIFAAGLAMAPADPSQTSAQAAAQLGNTPLIAVSGSDDETNPPGFIEGVAAADKAVSLTMVQGAGHDVWDSNTTGYGNPAIWSQLFSNTLGNPASSTGTSTAASGAPTSTTTPASTAAAPAVAASNAGSTIITPGKGTLTDAKGNTWTIVADGSVLENGDVWTPGGGGTSALTIINGTIYGQDASGKRWFTLASGDRSWVSSSAPTTTPASAPVATAAPVSSAAATVCGSMTQGAFGILNGQIYSPMQTVFNPRGIAIGTADISTFESMGLSLFPHINFIRLGTGYTDPMTPAQYAAFGQWGASHGIVVEIEDHAWTPNGDPVYTGSQLAQESAWYASIAAATISNSYVWFGTMNEPAGSATDIAAQELATYLAVRGTGSHTVVMLEAGGGAGIPGEMGSGFLPQSVYSQMSNVAFDLHYYAWVIPNGSTDQSTANATLANAVSTTQTITSAGGQKIPVIVGEFGNSTDGMNIDPNGAQVVNAVISAVPNEAVGFAAWQWAPSGTGADSVQENGSLTQVGQQISAAMPAGSSGPSNAAAACATTVTAANTSTALSAALGATSSADQPDATPTPDPTTQAATTAAITAAVSSADQDTAAADAIIARANSARSH